MEYTRISLSWVVIYDFIFRFSWKDSIDGILQRLLVQVLCTSNYFQLWLYIFENIDIVVRRQFSLCCILYFSNILGFITIKKYSAIFDMFNSIFFMFRPTGFAASSKSEVVCELFYVGFLGFTMSWITFWFIYIWRIVNFLGSVITWRWRCYYFNFLYSHIYDFFF